MDGTVFVTFSNALHTATEDAVVINVADATLVQKYAADIIKLTDDQLKRADVNFDGVVNVHDSTLIRKYAADIISSFK